MRAIIWDLCADLNHDLPRLRRRFCRLNYRGMHQRQNGAFSVFGANTPGPEFRGISRERGRRSLTRHAQGSDSPLGAHTSPRRSGKSDLGSRACQPQGCASAGRRADLRAAGGGNGRAGGARRAGFGGGRGNLRAFGRRTAGGSGHGRAKKPHKRELPGSQGCARAPGTRAKPGQAGSPSGRAPGKKRAEPGQNGAFGRAKRRIRRALGAKKPLFAAKKAGNGAVLGRKLAEKAGGACRVIWHLQGIFGRFRRKKLGLRKSLFTRI